jgi:hypothetical protein
VPAHSSSLVAPLLLLLPLAASSISIVLSFCRLQFLAFFFPVAENPGIVKPFLLLSRCEFLPFFNFIFWAPSAANYRHNGNHILFAVFSFRELTCVFFFFFCFFFFFFVVAVC